MSGRHAVDAVNVALQSDNFTATVRTLHSPALQLSGLLQQNADRFYHEELHCMRDEKQVCLSVCVSLCLYVCISVCHSLRAKRHTFTDASFCMYTVCSF